MINYQYTIDCRSSNIEIDSIQYNMNKRNDGTEDFMALCVYLDSIVSVDIISVNFDFITNKLTVLLLERIDDNTFTHIGDVVLTEVELNA